MPNIQRVNPERIDKALAQIAAPMDIGAIIATALDKGRSLDELRAAFELHKEMEAIRREQIFNVAFAEFKRVCPKIIRRTEDAFIKVTRNGARRARMYASLEDITSVVEPLLTELGFTYDWIKPDGPSPDDCVVRIFVLRHSSGHSRKTESEPIPIEGGVAHVRLNPKRERTSASPQQCVGVATTYAMRYSMVAGLGLTTCDEDDDGRLPRNANASDTEKITEQQYMTINDLCIQCGNDMANRVLKWQRVEKLSDIAADQFARVCASINKEIKQQQGGKQ